MKLTKLKKDLSILLILKIILTLFCISVRLVGGGNTYTGNVFALNPRTGIYGPVCHNSWDNRDVRIAKLYSKADELHALLIFNFAANHA